MGRKQEQNLFDLVPVKNIHIITEKEGELSVIAFLRFRNKFMQKYFVPRNKPPYIRVRLDAHGTAVWDLIDGERSVGKIVEELAACFNNESGYEYRIAAFVSQLQRQGYIEMRPQNL